MLDSTWGCDHDTPAHWKAIEEAYQGALRRCPACGADAVRRRGYAEWSEPSRAWKEAHQPERVEWEADRLEGDWSKPRFIPWLPWNHPNYRVTSPQEALRVCKEWGIDPELGFISETHRKRAQRAAMLNTREARSKFTAERRAKQRATRATAKAGGRAPVDKGHKDRNFVSFYTKNT